VSKMSAAAISYENVFSYIECVLSLYIGGQRRVKDVSSGIRAAEAARLSLEKGVGVANVLPLCC
jgi:hypothetical protein